MGNVIDYKLIEKLSSNFEHVQINYTKINYSLKTNSNFWDYTPTGTRKLLHFKSEEDNLLFLFIFHSINFCFWNNSKDTPEIRSDKVVDALYKFYTKNNNNNFSVKTLDNLSINNFMDIFMDEGNLSNIHLRWILVRENIDILSRKFEGRLFKLIKEADNKADLIVNSLVMNFPNFYDIGTYKNATVKYFKRAQALVYQLSEMQQYNLNVENIDRLSILPDYRLPQVLRYLGFINYSEKLSNMVDSECIIDSNSSYENEIRAATILVCKLISNQTGESLRQIDRILWEISQNKSIKLKPHHKTFSIFY